MNPEVTAVLPRENYSLLLTFTTGEQRVFSVQPYLEQGVFRELRDPAYFQTVRAVSGFVAWPHEQDFSADTLYLRSVPAAAS